MPVTRAIGNSKWAWMIEGSLAFNSNSASSHTEGAMPEETDSAPWPQWHSGHWFYPDHRKLNVLPKNEYYCSTIIIHGSLYVFVRFRKERKGGGGGVKKEGKRKKNTCLFGKKRHWNVWIGFFFKAPMTGSGHRVDKGDMLEDKGRKSSPVLQLEVWQLWNLCYSVNH